MDVKKVRTWKRLILVVRINFKPSKMVLRTPLLVRNVTFMSKKAQICHSFRSSEPIPISAQRHCIRRSHCVERGDEASFLLLLFWIYFFCSNVANFENGVRNLVQPDCSFPSPNNLLGHHTLIFLVSDNCTLVDQVYFHNTVVFSLFPFSRGPLLLIFWFLLWLLWCASCGKSVQYSCNFVTIHEMPDIYFL